MTIDERVNDLQRRVRGNRHGDDQSTARMLTEEFQAVVAAERESFLKILERHYDDASDAAVLEFITDLMDELRETGKAEAAE